MRTCPICGEEAEHGYVVPDRFGIKWIPDDGGVIEKEKKSIKLTSRLTNMNLESYVCRRCNLFFADIPDQTNTKLL
jgi:rubrerythrin